MILDPIGGGYHVLYFEDGHQEYVITTEARATEEMIARNAKGMATFETLADMLNWEKTAHDGSLPGV